MIINNKSLKWQHIFSVLLLCLLSSFAVIAQPAIEWNQSYGGFSNEQAEAVVANPDGSITIAGSTQSVGGDISANNGRFDCWVANIGPSGAIIWENNFGGSENDIAKSIIRTADNGYLIAGHTLSIDGDVSNNNGKGDIWVVKITASGQLSWEANYGGLNFDFTESIQETSDGGFIFAASSYSNNNNYSTNHGSSDLVVVKINNTGNVLWQKNYGGNLMDYARSIRTTQDGGSIIALSSKSNNGDLNTNLGLTDAWIIKLDMNGNKVWSKNFGTTTTDRALDIHQNEAGDYFFVGTYGSTDPNAPLFTTGYDENFWLAKLDANGNTLWSRDYGGTGYDNATAFCLAPDGGAVISGFSRSNDDEVPGNNGNTDFWILKTDTNGNIDWSQNYGGSESEIANDISNTPDGGFVIVGTSRSNDGDVPLNQGNEDCWVIKLEGNGTTPLSVSLTANNTTICDGASAMLSATTEGCLNCNYDWSNNSNLNAASQTIQPSSTATYIVTVTNSMGQTATDQATITVNNPPTILSSTVTPVSCDGNDGMISLALTGTAPINVVWSNGITGSLITDLPSGPISVTITDGNQCVTTAQYTVGQDSQISANENITNVDCNGASSGAINITPNGGNGALSFMWSNGFTTEDIDQLTAGSYVLTITDNSNCNFIETYVVTEQSPIIVSDEIGHVDCAGNNIGSINLTVSGGNPGYTFNWSNGNMTSNPQNLPAGIYEVTITDNSNCTTTESYTIFEGSSLQVSASVNHVDCFGGNDGSINIVPSGGDGNYNFNWSNGNMTGNPQNLTSGTYSFTLTDQNSCNYNGSINVNQPDAIELSGSISSLSCSEGNNGAINLAVQGGSSPYTYQWSNGQTTQDIGSLTADTYFVTVEDSNDCLATMNFEVTPSGNSISLTAMISPASCFGNNDGAIDLMVNGGNGNYSFDWDSGQNTEDINNLAAGVYTVLVTDGEGCMSEEQFIIDQINAITINPTTVEVSCFGLSDGSIQLNTSGGSTNFDYEWSSGQDTEMIENIPSGTYFVTITDSNDCQMIEVFEINEPDEIVLFSNTNNVSCFGLSDGMLNVTASGGSGMLDLNWNTNQNLNALTAGEYMVTITDQNTQCELIESYIIDQPDTLEGDVIITNISCSGLLDGAIDLTPSGGIGDYTFLWNINNQMTEDVDELPAGSYTVLITDENDCVSVVNATVTEPAPIVILFDPTYPTTGNDGALQAIVIGGQSPYIYNWSDGQTGPLATNLSPGNYTVTITDDNDCTTSTSFLLTPASNEELSAIDYFNVFPNPNTGIFWIDIVQKTNRDLTIKVFNTLGQRLKEWKESDAIIHKTVSLENLSSGLYFIEISSEDGRIVKRVEITK